MPQRRSTHWSFLGTVAYRRAEELQVAVRDALRQGTGPERLLLLEHTHVFTLGRSASRGDVIATDAWLEERGVEIAECDRGGQVTYHGPGQLVGYPILDLNPDRRDIRRYVRDLQEALVRTLADFGVEARGEGEQSLIGVWSGPFKVASIGVHLSRWITTHGFALNVSTDLSLFDGIVPCGLSSVRMASIASLTGESPAVADVASRLAFHFGEVFDRQMVPSESAVELVEREPALAGVAGEGEA